MASNFGMDIHIDRADLVRITAALEFGADHADHSLAWELLKLRDRVQDEWNTEMRRRRA